MESSADAEAEDVDHAPNSACEIFRYCGWTGVSKD